MPVRKHKCALTYSVHAEVFEIDFIFIDTTTGAVTPASYPQDKAELVKEADSPGPGFKRIATKTITTEKIKSGRITLTNSSVTGKSGTVDVTLQLRIKIVLWSKLPENQVSCYEATIKNLSTNVILELTKGFFEPNVFDRDYVFQRPKIVWRSCKMKTKPDCKRTQRLKILDEDHRYFQQGKAKFLYNVEAWPKVTYAVYPKTTIASIYKKIPGKGMTKIGIAYKKTSKGYKKVKTVYSASKTKYKKLSGSYYKKKKGNVYEKITGILYEANVN